MPKIVQFTHPGPEHEPDKRNGIHKSWNTKDHKRKFLLSRGQYVSHNNLNDGNLAFWGEWEPPSHVKKIAEQPSKYHPHWLHRPYLPSTYPEPGDDGLQNTDPCVFGNEFRYFICKQGKNKTTTKHCIKTETIILTSLARLDEGSLILFGSTINQNKEDAFFQLDTVFVVASFIEYDVSDPNALASEDLGEYRDYVFNMASRGPSVSSAKFRLYRGATYEFPQNGMYSFSPAQVWNNQPFGFPRIPLRNMEYITNNLNSAPKISEASNEEIKKFWDKIVILSRESGCVEGVQFNYERE